MKFMPFCSDVISSSMFSNIKQQLFFVDLTTKIVVLHKFFGLFQLQTWCDRALSILISNFHTGETCHLFTFYVHDLFLQNMYSII